MNKDIKESQKIIDTDNINSFNYNSMYPFTTENIKGLIENINVYNKDILIPLSSGDHLFNFILNNPNSITTFDINSLSKYIYELKRASIIKLDIDDYLKFFYINSTNIYRPYNKKIYKYIRKYLSIEALEYWDFIILNTNYKKLIKSPLIKNCTYRKKDIININNYLNEINYYKLKDILKDYKLEFINEDIKHLSNKLTKNYDFIYLSNIADYMDRKDIFINLKEILLNLDKYLNNYGIIGIVYLFNYMDEYFYNSNNPLYNYKERNKYFNSKEYDYINFNSVYLANKSNNINNKDKDGVLIYKKLKK